MKWLPSGSLVQLAVAGATSSVAFDVNDSGTVAGAATINGVSQAVLRDSIGAATILGAGSAHRVTNAGWAVGQTGGDVVRWNASGVRTVLDTGTLLAVNELADAGGTVGTDGVLWSRTNTRTRLGAGTQTLLPSVPGAARHSVSGLSEAGQVIGVANFANGTYHAVVWR